MNYKELQKLNEIIEVLKANPNEDENIQFVLELADKSLKAETLERLLDSGNNNPLTVERRISENGQSHVIIFTKKEILHMDKTFKKYFILNGYIAHVTKRRSGKSGVYYEIRFRRNGYNIRAASVNLNEAKRIFLEKTLPENIGKYLVKKQKSGRNLLEEIFEEWYKYKKGTVLEKEMKRFQVNFNGLPETLRKTPIDKIRTIDIDEILKAVKPRKYEELRTLFNGMFKYAIASGIITHNPVALIKFKRAERKNRDALSKNDIITFLDKIQRPKYERIKQASLLLYFFGLRPCEVDEETRREGNFLVVRNRKRKNGKIEYKKIPIPLQAENLIDWNKPLTFGVTPKIYYDWYKEILGDKTPYYLRHTFSTVCQQYVRPDIVDIWMGDSPQRLVGKVYTHFPDDFMYEQMQKVQFPI